jgi:transcriptional regulator with XRE-family HTH domain
VNRFLTQLGRRIRELRSKKGWSQEEFGQISGLHRTFVAHVEGGKKNLSFDSLMTIATHLGVPLEKLVSGLEERARAEDMALPEPKRRTSQGKEPKAPELQRILTQLRGQRASLDRTITRLDEFANLQPPGSKMTKRKSALKSK